MWHNKGREKGQKRKRNKNGESMSAQEMVKEQYLNKTEHFWTKLNQFESITSKESLMRPICVSIQWVEDDNL